MESNLHLKTSIRVLQKFKLSTMLTCCWHCYCPSTYFHIWGR